MDSTFGLEIYASNKLFYTGRARSLVIPVEDGQKAFLAHHVNTISAIVPGEMRYEDTEGNWTTVAVSSGFMEMISSSSFSPPNFRSAKLGIDTFGFPVRTVVTQESEQVDSPTNVNSSFS